MPKLIFPSCSFCSSLCVLCLCIRWEFFDFKQIFIFFILNISPSDIVNKCISFPLAFPIISFDSFPNFFTFNFNFDSGVIEEDNKMFNLWSSSITLKIVEFQTFCYQLTLEIEEFSRIFFSIKIHITFSLLLLLHGKHICALTCKLTNGEAIKNRVHTTRDYTRKSSSVQGKKKC